MTRLFDAEIGARVGAFDRSMWAPLVANGWLRLTAEWQRVSPEATQLPLHDATLHDLRRLAGFMIGETDQNWSNASLARAMSRLFTGTAVELRLVRRVGAIELPPRVKAGVTFGPGRRAVLVFEGWDAAGKGGIIQRLTASLDPRYFEVWPISAPNE